MEKWNTVEIRSPSGALLNAYAIMPGSGSPRAMVQINHGMAEHAARYRRFGEFLALRGYGVLAHDHRGHGATTAPGTQLGQFGGWDNVLADVSAAQDHCRSIAPSAPVVCFGHSMGAIIAMSHALAFPGRCDALAVWNTGFETPILFHIGIIILKVERMLKGSDVPSALAPKLTFDAWNARFKPNRTAFDWLSRDNAEVDKYVADPLCGFSVSIGAWLDVLNAIARVRKGDLSSLPAAMPVSLRGGGQDMASELGKAMQAHGERLKSAGMQDVTVTINPDARHECLNEIDRDAAMSDFVAWLDARFSSASR